MANMAAQGMADKGEAILFSTAGASTNVLNKLYTVLNGELAPVSSNLLNNGMEQALLEVQSRAMAYPWLFCQCCAIACAGACGCHLPA